MEEVLNPNNYKIFSHLVLILFLYLLVFNSFKQRKVNLSAGAFCLTGILLILSQIFAISVLLKPKVITLMWVHHSFAAFAFLNWLRLSEKKPENLVLGKGSALTEFICRTIYKLENIKSVFWTLFSFLLVLGLSQEGAKFNPWRIGMAFFYCYGSLFMFGRFFLKWQSENHPGLRLRFFSLAVLYFTFSLYLLIEVSISGIVAASSLIQVILIITLFFHYKSQLDKRVLSYHQFISEGLARFCVVLMLTFYMAFTNKLLDFNSILISCFLLVLVLEPFTLKFSSFLQANIFSILWQTELRIETLIQRLGEELRSDHFESLAVELLHKEKLFEKMVFMRLPSFKKQLSEVLQGDEILNEIAKGKPLMLEELYDQLEEVSTSSLGVARIKSLVKTLEEQSWSYLWPVIISDQISGIILVDTPLSRNRFVPMEVMALKRVSALWKNHLEEEKAAETLSLDKRLGDIAELGKALAHEIRNPLAAIKGAGQALQDIELENEDKALVDIIIKHSQRTEQVVSRFLQFSALEKLDLDQILIEEFNDYLDNFVSETKITYPDVLVELSLDNLESKKMIQLEKEWLRDILDNMVRNSMDALAKETQNLKVNLSLHLNEYKLQLNIADNAKGIPQEDWDQIFKPFFTTKTKGSGLGLPLAQKYMQAMGGNIRLLKSNSDGSVFQLSFRLFS